MVDGRVVAFADGAARGRRARRRARSARAATRGRWTRSTLLAPIPEPGTIYAIGLNYAKHVAETGSHRARGADRVRQGARLGRAARRPGPLPRGRRRLDYEGELTIVIGADGAIGGYCIADDVTARDLQGREPQWTRAKGADTFCPFGPWVTTADEVPNADDLRLRTWVNGELRQDSRTSDLIFDCQDAGRLHRPDLHAAAGRSDPHRHPQRGRDGLRPAAVSAAQAIG